MTGLHLLHLADFKKPDIVSALEKEGITFKEKNKYLWALCPLHSEKTPSFMVDKERQIGHCFGCGFHGDVIAFFRKYKGLSFKEALSYLGISTGRPTPEAIKKIQQEKHKRELIKGFRQWCNNYHNDLCRLYRTLQKAKSKAKTIEEVEALNEFYHRENIWLYQIETLQSGDDKSRFELFREVVYGD